MKSPKVRVSIFVKILLPLVVAMALIHVVIVASVAPSMRSAMRPGLPPPVGMFRMEKGPGGDFGHGGPPPHMRGPGPGRFPGPPPVGNPVEYAGFWFLLALQMGFILLICYGILARQLRPIKFLSEAITQLGAGNLRYRMRRGADDELGVLGAGLNDMAERFESLLRAKEELLLGVSHELRSPLASANVLVEMVDDEHRKAQIKTHLKRMEVLISELLESHRVASEHAAPRMERVDLAKLFATMQERLGEVAPGLVCEAPPAGSFVEGDLRSLERLLANLIDNAQKYSKSSGVAVRLTAREEGDSIRLDVVDSGPGIPAEDLGNVFEPFYRVDKSRTRETGGFGLGLYLCAQIARMHHGRIVAANRAEGGCRFSVFLPHYGDTSLSLPRPALVR